MNAQPDKRSDPKGKYLVIVLVIVGVVSAVVALKMRIMAPLPPPPVTQPADLAK